MINLHDIIFKPNYGLAMNKNAAAGQVIGQKSATKEKMLIFYEQSSNKITPLHTLFLAAPCLHEKGVVSKVSIF